MKSNELGKWLTNKLNIINEVKNKIYPIYSKTGTDYPFIVYQRTSSTARYTKDGLANETVIMDIGVISDVYSKAVDIAVKVRDVLDNITTQEVQSELTNTTETAEPESNAYIQNLTYTIKINA
jgi:hypothetical protein